MTPNSEKKPITPVEMPKRTVRRPSTYSSVGRGFPLREPSFRYMTTGKTYTMSMPSNEPRKTFTSDMSVK